VRHAYPRLWQMPMPHATAISLQVLRRPSSFSLGRRRPLQGRNKKLEARITTGNYTPTSFRREHCRVRMLCPNILAAQRTAKPPAGQIAIVLPSNLRIPEVKMNLGRRGVVGLSFHVERPSMIRALVVVLARKYVVAHPLAVQIMSEVHAKCLWRPRWRISPDICRLAGGSRWRSLRTA